MPNNPGKDSFLIAIVGGGSSLAQGGIELFARRGDDLVVFSRTRPELASQVEWIQTGYDVKDGSIDHVARLNISKVVWLASPFPMGLMVDHDENVIKEAIETGVHYPTRFAQACLPSMIQNQFGRFVFAGSRLASIGDEGALLYMIIKQGLLGLSRGLGLEYARLGIRSNTIELGPMESGYASRLPAKRLQEYRNRTASRTFVTAEEFWETADFLLGSGSINGVAINLDGGLR